MMKNDLNLRSLRMFESIFSLDGADFIFSSCCSLLIEVNLLASVPEISRKCLCTGYYYLRPWAQSVLDFVIAPEAFYERSWTGPMLFSIDCSTLL